MTMPDDLTPDSGSSSRLRTIAPFVLIAALVVTALTVVFLRGMDGPLVVQNTGGGAPAAIALGDRVAATVEIRLPEGDGAKITAVRTAVGGGLEIVEDYITGSEGAPAPKSAYTWTGEVQTGDADPKQPGAFNVRPGAGVGAVLTAVGRPTRTGLVEFKAIEVDYQIGSKHHRKRVGLDFRVCVNPKGTTDPVATPACKRTEAG